MISANSRIRFGLQTVFVCLYSTPSHYHHCANLSEDIELIKCLSDIFCRVCKIKHIFSVNHYTTCGAVCFKFTNFPCDDWENIYIFCLIIIIKSEVWTITHCLGLSHETMMCAVCLSIFLQERNIEAVNTLLIYYMSHRRKVYKFTLILLIYVHRKNLHKKHTHVLSHTTNYQVYTP